LYKFKELGIIN